jgi:hypothetical protein
MTTPGWEQPRYVREPFEVQKKEVHPLWRAVKHFAILYVIVYAFAFTVEGVTRLRHHVGPRPAIERLPTRQLRAKAEVARARELDQLEEDPTYKAYLIIMLLGGPILSIVLFILDGRLLWRMMARFEVRYRIIVIVFASLFLLTSGMVLVFRAMYGAIHFYDRISPAQILAWLSGR